MSSVCPHSSTDRSICRLWCMQIVSQSHLDCTSQKCQFSMEIRILRIEPLKRQSKFVEIYIFFFLQKITNLPIKSCDKFSGIVCGIISVFCDGAISHHLPYVRCELNDRNIEIHTNLRKNSHRLTIANVSGKSP